MKIKQVAYVALLCGGATLASCSSTTGNTACPPITVAGPQMIYPEAGATGVPTNSGQLFVAGSQPSAGSVLVPNNHSASLATSEFVVVPSSESIPTPAATPIVPGAIYAASYGTLAAHTTYTVTYPSANTGQCKAALTPSGSFTTE